MANDTIPADVSDALSVEDDGEDAFLANLTGEEPRKRAAAPEADTAAAPEASSDPEAEAETPEAEGEETPDPNDPDNAEVEIKVGDETKKATLRDLKRLYGQEASLTQKSQKVAEATRVADEAAARATAALNGMLERAKAKHAPYADLDMLVLSQRMDTETFEALRKDAAAAKADVDYLSSELGTHTQAEQQRQGAAFQEAAQACVAALSDPKTGIPGWGQPLYTDLMKFANENGLSGAQQIVQPAAIKMLHMAYQFSRGQTAAAVAAQKVAAAPARPTKQLRPGSGQPAAAASRGRDAMNALRKSGSVDDAADAFLASFGA